MKRTSEQACFLRYGVQRWPHHSIHLGPCGNAKARLGVADGRFHLFGQRVDRDFSDAFLVDYNGVIVVVVDDDGDDDEGGDDGDDGGDDDDGDDGDDDDDDDEMMMMSDGGWQLLGVGIMMIWYVPGIVGI